MSTSSLGRIISEHRRRDLGSPEDLESTGSVSSSSNRLKLKRLQSAEENEGFWVCKFCGYSYDEPHPRARVRREHKKICPGTRSRLGRLDEESSAKQEEQPSEESQSAIRDLGSEEPVQVDTGDSGITKEREPAATPDVQSSITQEIHSPSVQQGPESVNDETLQLRDSGTGEEVSAAEQVSHLEVVEARGQQSRENEVTRGGVRAGGGDGELEEEDGLQHRRGSRGTSVTEDYDSEYFDQYIREREILSSDDGDRGDRESVQSEEDEEYPAVGRATLLGEEESATAKQRPGLRRRGDPRSEISEITLAEDSAGGDTTTATTSSPRFQGRDENFDVALILRNQTVFDIFCPICGGDITRRIIARKKKRSFVSKEEGLRRREAGLKASPSAVGEQQQHRSMEEIGKGNSKTNDSESDDEDTTWLENCLSYFYAQIRTSPALKKEPE